MLFLGFYVRCIGLDVAACTSRACLDFSRLVHNKMSNPVHVAHCGRLSVQPLVTTLELAQYGHRNQGQSYSRQNGNGGRRGGASNVRGIKNLGAASIQGGGG